MTAPPAPEPTMTTSHVSSKAAVSSRPMTTERSEESSRAFIVQ